jgi:hypothetical protein
MQAMRQREPGGDGILRLLCDCTGEAGWRSYFATAIAEAGWQSGLFDATTGNAAAAAQAVQA